MFLALVLDAAAGPWPWFALTLVPGAVVFALDGGLIGAGDAPSLAGAMMFAAAVFLPLALLADDVVALRLALDALMLARLLPLGVRFARGRWAVPGPG